MQATETELQALMQLKSLDVEIVRNQKKLEELPQRKELVEIRQKMAEILKKKTQVQDMIDVAEDEMAKLMAEDERLACKQKVTQESLDRVKGDYRSVESYSKDLSGVMKRREKITDDMSEVDKRMSKIMPVMNQIMAGFTKLESREKNLVASYQEEGGQLQQEVENAQSVRAGLLEKLDPSLLKAYQHACKECGGIGVAELVNDSCGTCRSAFDSNRMNKIRQEKPISNCPSCRRLLIVND